MKITIEIDATNPTDLEQVLLGALSGQVQLATPEPEPEPEPEEKPKRTRRAKKAEPEPEEEETEEGTAEDEGPEEKPKRTRRAKKAEPEPEPEPEDDEDDDKGSSLKQAVDLATRLVSEGKLKVVKEQLKALGVTRVSELSEDDAEAFLTTLG